MKKEDKGTRQVIDNKKADSIDWWKSTKRSWREIILWKFLEFEREESFSKTLAKDGFYRHCVSLASPSQKERTAIT